MITLTLLLLTLVLLPLVRPRARASPRSRGRGGRLALLALPLLLGVFGGTCAREASAQDAYHWAKRPEWPDCEALYLGGQLVGAWNYAEAKYYPWWGAGWGPAGMAPARPPVRNFGVGLDGARRDACFSDHERASIGGYEVTPEYARRKLIESCGAGDLPEDRGKPFAVVVGSEANEQAARRLLEQAPFKQAVRVQCYRPDDDMVRDRDGRVMYTAGITLVSAAGAVAGHSDRFDNAEDLAEGLRRLDPKTDPTKFPSLKDRGINTALGPLIPHVAPIAGGVLLLGAAGLAYFTRRKR